MQTKKEINSSFKFVNKITTNYNKLLLTTDYHWQDFNFKCSGRNNKTNHENRNIVTVNR